MEKISDLATLVSRMRSGEILYTPGSSMTYWLSSGTPIFDRDECVSVNSYTVYLLLEQNLLVRELHPSGLYTIYKLSETKD